MSGVAWRGYEAALFEEAMRVVPAAAKHRAEGRLVDVATIYRAYRQTAEEYGIDSSTAWAILTSAYSVWLQNLFALYAHEVGASMDKAIDSAIGAAADWASNRA